MAHIRQSRPDYGLCFQAKVLETFQVVPSSLGSGRTRGGQNLLQGFGCQADHVTLDVRVLRRHQPGHEGLSQVTNLMQSL